MVDPLDSSGNAANPVETADNLSAAMDGVQTRANALVVSADRFSTAMAKAFSQATTGGKSFDDALKSLALRISSLSVTAAFKPLAAGITGGLNSMFSGLFGGSSSGGASVAAAMGAIKPFAAGGVIGTPTYFPLTSGGTGLAGEAGPEAIMPLARGRDGRLGIATQGAGGNVTVQISTPDPDSFRRSEAYLTGQIARAVARGQRSL